MSFSDYLSIGGIVISVLFGIWGIYLTLRRAHYPGGLTFVREQSVALLHDFATKIPNLAVLYKDLPIEKTVVLLSGYVVNDGALDITQNMTEQPLTCTLPSNCAWLEFKVTTVAPALNVHSLVVDKSKVELSFSLFRRDESFSFQALALLDADAKHATKKISDFADGIQWSHRIAGLGEVKTTQMPREEKRGKREKWIRRLLYALFVLFYVALGLSQATGFGPLASVPPLAYQVETSGEKALVHLTPNRDGTTTVRDVETGNETEVDLAEFVKKTTFTPVRIAKRDNLTLFSGLIMLLASIGFSYAGFSSDIKRYRIRKLIAASKRES